MNVNKPYQFTRLHQWLTQKGYPEIDPQNHFKIIKEIDFEKVFKEGKISFINENDEDGIFIEYKNKKYRGYMFIQEAHLHYDGNFKLPKFHTRKCGTIQQFIDNGRFQSRYVFSNTSICNLIDIDTGQKYEKQTLQLCRNCHQSSDNEYTKTMTTEEFHQLLVKHNQHSLGNIQIDIFGYTSDWHRISSKYRKEKAYKCELCGRQSHNIRDHRWWHVDHINGDKLDNRIENLQCLCILCHSQKDLTHKENFNTNIKRKELQTFIQKYG